MEIKAEAMIFSYALTRILNNLKEKGFIGTARAVIKHLNRGVVQYHPYVTGRNLVQNNPPPETEIDLKICEMTLADNDDIDELTKIDEWGMQKSDTLKMLEEGQHCYVAKHQGKIVACHWVVMTEKFEESNLLREIRLAPYEAYGWRSFTYPSFRGKGVFPVLLGQMDVDLAQRFGKTFIYGLVRPENKSMLRALHKRGETQIGRIGYFQFLGIRFQYLWGHHAFKKTKQRFKIQMLW